MPPPTVTIFGSATAHWSLRDCRLSSYDHIALYKFYDYYYYWPISTKPVGTKTLKLLLLLIVQLNCFIEY